MPKLNEVIDSLNNENVEELKETLKTETIALEKEKQRLYSRAKKAEGFEQDKVTKKWVKKEVKVEEKKPEAKTVQSNEPDYAKIAYLNSSGYTHPDDQKLVQDEAIRLKLPLTDILGMDHIKSKLTVNKDQREAQAGMPKGRGSSAGKTQQDVEYWLQKGETPDDQELAEKVIAARIKKESQGNKFSDELYTG